MSICEICGSTYNLTEVYVCACDKTSPHATLCKKCKEKYFDYMCQAPGVITKNLNNMWYIPWLSFADNLVYAYNVRHENNDTRKKQEVTTMEVTYHGFTGELEKLEKKKVINQCPPFDKPLYDLSIYDSVKQVTHYFSSINLTDVKFLCGEVTFGG